MNSVLADSSFVFALYHQQDNKHIRARDYVLASKPSIIYPQMILNEVTFLFNRFGGIRDTTRFLESFNRSHPQLESLTSPDLERVRQIMLTYPTARFDFVDCCIMALAERLNIAQVCTFDRRDFSIFRPTHCDSLELLP